MLKLQVKPSASAANSKHEAKIYRITFVFIARTSEELMINKGFIFKTRWIMTLSIGTEYTLGQEN